MITCTTCQTTDLKWVYAGENGSYIASTDENSRTVAHICYPTELTASDLVTNFRKQARQAGVSQRWISVWMGKIYDIRDSKYIASDKTTSGRVALEDFQTALDSRHIKGLGKNFRTIARDFIFHQGQYVKKTRLSYEQVKELNEGSLNQEQEVKEQEMVTVVEAPTTDLQYADTPKFDFSQLGELGQAIENLQHPIDVEAIKEMAKDAANQEAKQVVESMVPVEHKILINIEGKGKVLEFDGRPHRLFEELLTLMSMDEGGRRLHCYLVGPAGSGKTTAVGLAAKALNLRFTEQSMGPATSGWDLVGFRNAATGDYVPGILRDAYENGGVVLLDEMDNANPSVLTTLNSAISNGHYTFPDGVMVERHPDFVLVAAGNTYGKGADRLYVGRNQLDAAFLDRWITIDWDYDEDLERDIAQLDWWVQWVQRVRKAAFDSQMRVVISPRASIDGAIMIRGGMEPSRVAELRVWGNMSADDRNRLESQAGKPVAPQS